MVNKGFSFIEIVIALLLSSLMLGVILQITYRVTAQERFAKKNLDKDLKVMMVHMQLLKDISGICALVYEQEEEKKDQKTSTVIVGKPAALENKDKTSSERYFYSINKDNHVDFFTFVTTNSLTFYGQETKPLVRVLYRLSQEKDRQTYALSRKEIASLSFKDAQQSNAQGALLLDGITKFEVIYFYVKPEQKKEKSEKSEKKGESEAAQLGSSQEWGIAKAEKEEDEKQKIPRYIAIRFECENGLKKELWYEVPFVFESLPGLPHTKTSEKISGQKSPDTIIPAPSGTIRG